MFNRYFRHYPWGLQLVLLLMLILTLSSFIVVVEMVMMPKIFGVALTDIANVSESSPRSLIHAALWSQLVMHLFTFLIPAVLFAYWAHPLKKEYLGWRKPGKKLHWLLIPILMLSAMPVILFMENTIRTYIHFPDRFMEMQEMNDRLISTFLDVHNLPEFLLSMTVMALAPAIGEELLFRSLLMRFIAKTKWGFAFAIVMSSLLFMIMHPNPIGYVPIFLAGILLGLIYYWTGSIWMAILAHLVNNGVQVMLMALANQHENIRLFVEASQIPLPLVMAGIAGTTISLWLLYRKRTPLKKDWYIDFDEGEVS